MSLCEECKLLAAVGWGNPPVWLCVEHFEEKLAGARVLFDRAVRWLEDDGTVTQADYSSELG